MSLNVHAGNPDKAQVLDYLRATDADVFFLMEVDAEWAAALAELTATHPHQLLRPQEDNFGLAFFSRVPLQSLEVIHTSELGSPSIRARLTHAAPRARDPRRPSAATDRTAAFTDPRHASSPTPPRWSRASTSPCSSSAT